MARAGSVFDEVVRSAAAGLDLEETTALVHTIVGFSRPPVEEARRRCRDELSKQENDPVLRRALQLLDGVLAAGLLE